MLLKDIADQMLSAYQNLAPEQQLEVLMRVWAKEQAAGRGMGKAMLLAILIFEAMEVPPALITPESLVGVVQIMREMADRMKGLN